MKRLLIAMTIVTLLVLPQFALGSDVNDLKAVNEQSVEAWNSLDAATLASMVHPGFVSFDRDSAFASELPMNQKEAEAENFASLKSYFDTLESLKVTLIDYKYRIVGNTGIVWGYWTSEAKPKDGPVETIQARGTYTWIKSDGKWRIIAAHASAIPSGD